MLSDDTEVGGIHHKHPQLHSLVFYLPDFLFMGFHSWMVLHVLFGELELGSLRGEKEQRR